MKDILTVIAGGVGDCILYSHLFHAIKRTYPQSRVTCVVWSHGYPSPYRFNPFIDELIEIHDFKGKDRLDKAKLIAGKHYDIVYAINHLRELYYLIDLVKFDKFFGHYSDDPKYERVVPPHLRRLIKEHEAEGYTYPLFDLGIMYRKCEVYYNPIHKLEAMRHLRSLSPEKKNVVVSLTSADLERTIPFKVQNKIFRDLSKKYNFIGVARFNKGAEDRALSFEFHNNIDVKHIKLILDTDEHATLTINGLIALIEEADFYITPLSMGIALADCTKTPILTIMAHRLSIGKMIPQYTSYCPSSILAYDSLNDVKSWQVDLALKGFQKFPQIMFRRPQMFDYREKHKPKEDKGG